MAFSSAVAQIRAEYKLRNGDSERLTGELAVEFGFGGFPFPAGESSLFVDTEVHLKLEELHDRPNSHTILLHSRLYDFGVMMTSSDAFRLHAYPLHTVSLSESGFEKVYQGIILLPAWQLRLEQEEEFSVSLQLSVFQGNEMKSLARLRNHVSQAAP
jgi:alpha-amylase